MNIKITVDMNDADYNEYTSIISDEELNIIKPLILAIKDFKAYRVEVEGMSFHHNNNYPYGSNLPRTDLGEKFPNQLYPEISEEVFGIFESHCPHCEYGFRSIESIEIWPEVPITKLL